MGDVCGQLVTCRLNELRPHPTYVRHHLTVPADQLSTLAERGDRAFLEPLAITQDRTIVDGYARWEGKKGVNKAIRDGPRRRGV